MDLEDGKVSRLLRNSWASIWMFGSRFSSVVNAFVNTLLVCKDGFCFDLESRLEKIVGRGGDVRPDTDS